MTETTVNTIIGIDAAVAPERTGVAVARRNRAGRSFSAQAFPRTRDHARLVERIGSVVAGTEGPVLLAIDAPLGWPRLLSASLANHRAGRPLPENSHRLFRRETDFFVRKHLGKQTLDVGADRIARTAHAALKLVAEVSAEAGVGFEMAWEPDITRHSMIEVYPAAWLIVNGLESTGYKQPDRAEARRRIVAEIANRGTHVETPEVAARNPDALDALVCVRLGTEFLLGRCIAPTDRPLAEQEGWIFIPRALDPN